MDLFGRKTIKALNGALDIVCLENARLRKELAEYRAKAFALGYLCEKCAYGKIDLCTQDDLECSFCKDRCLCDFCEDGSNFVWEGD